MNPPRCPTCGGPVEGSSYRAHAIPRNSVLLQRSREEARAIPRGDLDLSRCNVCGFIWNRLFEPGTPEYSSRYEETQGFSPRFGSFADALARKLIERHDVGGRRVVEIGCGKGEFLTRLCKLGGCEGIGIDPAYVPGRNPEESDANVRFLTETLSEAHAGLAPDLVICRHTLEHIPDVRAFLALVRACTPASALLFLEVPDVTRILRKAAFWDVYYEHCSYFGAGSLSLALALAGFETIETGWDFDSQYLLVTARACEPLRAPVPPADLSESRRRFRALEVRAGRKIERWRRTLSEHAERGDRIALWGGGSKAVAFLAAVDPEGTLETVVDVNPYRQGTFLPGCGREIVAPEALVALQPELVVAMNGIYCEEIQADLDRLGLSSSLVALP